MTVDIVAAVALAAVTGAAEYGRRSWRSDMDDLAACLTPPRVGD